MTWSQYVSKGFNRGRMACKLKEERGQVYTVISRTAYYKPSGVLLYDVGRELGTMELGG